ncbi:MAG: biotin/lipoyl-containing protein, partial [Sphingomicrobium sp.]
MPLKAFTMPKWGIEMSEGMIGEWMAAEGKPFSRGQVLALIETDKITNEVEAEADGKFVRILAQPGETLPVGALLAVYGDDEPA